MADRYRGWIFTINNWTERDLFKTKESLAQATWGIYGKEVAPTTGTPHLQGAVYYKHPKTMGGVCKALGGRATLHVMAGTPQQNKDYCSKSGDWEEFGAMPAGQGARKDLAWVRERRDDGASMEEIIEEVENMQQVQYAKTLFGQAKQKQRDQPEIIWIWGPAGCGKTRKAWEYSGYEDTWANAGTLQWFDGYRGETTAIFDDFEVNQCDLKWFLRLTDRHPLRVPVKGGFVPWTPKRIVITALEKPEEMYHLLTEGQLYQVTRRLTSCIQLH